MHQLDKNLIKLVPDFSEASFLVCSEKHARKLMKYYLTNLFFACSQIQAGAACIASCKELSTIMHTLLWQHLKIAEII